MNINKIFAILFTTALIALTGCGGNTEVAEVQPNIVSVANQPNEMVVAVAGMGKTSANVETPTVATASMGKTTYCAPTNSNTTSGGGSNISTATDEQIIANIKLSNIEHKPGYYGRAAGTWRWQEPTVTRIAVYLPTPRSKQEQGYFDDVKVSIEDINRKLKGAVVLEATNYQPVANHIQVSYNTSHVPQGFTDYKSGNYCANVSTRPGDGEPIAPDWKNNIASSPVYINLGNGQCTVTKDIIVHEFGHALGLAEHFKGFGIGPAISEEYWDTLSTLYHNGASTKAENIVVKRAFK